LVYPS